MDSKTANQVLFDIKEFISTQYADRGVNLQCSGNYGENSIKITGINTRRPRFPISASRVSDNRPMKFPALAVKSGMVSK